LIHLWLWSLILQHLSKINENMLIKSFHNQSSFENIFVAKLKTAASLFSNFTTCLRAAFCMQIPKKTVKSSVSLLPFWDLLVEKQFIKRWGNVLRVSISSNNWRAKKGFEQLFSNYNLCIFLTKEYWLKAARKILVKLTTDWKMLS